MYKKGKFICYLAVSLRLIKIPLNFLIELGYILTTFVCHDVYHCAFSTVHDWSCVMQIFVASAQRYTAGLCIVDVRFGSS